MTTYYIKGGSKFDEANPNVWVYTDLSGYPSGHYLDTGWKDLATSGAVGDPYWRLGGNGGIQQGEFGLYSGSRIRITSGGVHGWSVESGIWVSLLGTGVIAGDLLHNDLTGLNAGTDYEHITQTQKDALHAIYTLEVHDNDEHDPNYAAETRVFEQSTTFPESPSEGDLHYDEDDDSLYRYNAEAEAWIEVGASGISTGSAGVIGSKSTHLHGNGNQVGEFYEIANLESLNCSWRLEGNINTSQDVVIVITYRAYTIGTTRMEHYIQSKATNNTETPAWDIENGTERDYIYGNEYRTMKITVNAADIAEDDILRFKMTYDGYYGTNRPLWVYNITLLYTMEL